MSRDWERIKEGIAELSPDTILWDGFDEALVGLEETTAKAVYDVGKMVKILIERDDMTEEEALDYLNYNVFNAYVGKMTPIHICTFL